MGTKGTASGAQADSVPSRKEQLPVPVLLFSKTISLQNFIAECVSTLYFMCRSLPACVQTCQKAGKGVYCGHLNFGESL